jgi:small subunit ribosomal protein S9
MPPTTTKTKKEVARYFEAVGRRKTSVARVRLTPTKTSGFVVNKIPFKTYFDMARMQYLAMRPLIETGNEGGLHIEAHINGGGIKSQAGALSHAIARALVVWSPDFKLPLRSKKLLTRDPRAKERRKFGLKKARKSPQWSKR